MEKIVKSLKGEKNEVFPELSQEKSMMRPASTFSKKKKVIFLVVVLLVSVPTAIAVYFGIQLQYLKNDPKIIAEQELRELVSFIGKLIVLPQDEVPTIATVNDPDKLKSQAFFSLSQQGDKVLLYANAKKAILYRPSEHKIVEVAPINFDEVIPSEAVTE